MAVREGMADVYVALKQLKRTGASPQSRQTLGGGGLTGHALVAALTSVNPRRVQAAPSPS